MNITVIEIFIGPLVYLAHIIGYFLCSFIVYSLADWESCLHLISCRDWISVVMKLVSLQL